MSLKDVRTMRAVESAAGADGRALLDCARADELIFAGRHEDACELLARFWRGVGERPSLEGLGGRAAAEVLLRCGALCGRIGSSRHTAGAQEAAQDLLSESLAAFERLGESAKVSEAQYELGFCYWRLGALNEARDVLADALGRLGEEDLELRAKILIRQAVVEISAHRYHDAWAILAAAEPVFGSASDAWKGRWHSQKAHALLKLHAAEGRSDYADRAIIEFTAAVHYYEQAGHERFRGASLNNLAFMLNRLGRYAEAHEQLDRARAVFTRLDDSGVVAQVDETRARVLAAEGRYAEAASVVGRAIATLREGGEHALVADALVVQACIQSHTGAHAESVATLGEAMSVAEGAGAHVSAGHAALTLIEEHGEDRLSAAEVYETYRRADELLARTQDGEDVARLRACARVALGRLAEIEIPEGFSLPDAVRAYEARFIVRALALEGGSVSRAARRLGIKHQSLTHAIRTRHADLIHARTPPVPRRRSIARAGRPQADDDATELQCDAAEPQGIEGKEAQGVGGEELQGNSGGESRSNARAVVILHVEDDPFVADAVRDVLESEGWRVEACADGDAALGLVEGQSLFDLLLIDYDLPGLSGLELARRARLMPQRRDMPILMLSAGDHAAEAQRAGIDAFLKKPDGIDALVETITLLLAHERT